MARRTGDTARIDGAYQCRAITEGNPVQRFWHETKKIVIDRFLPPNPTDRVLDVGCGSGVVASFLGEFGATVLGLDGSERAVQFAQATFQSENVTFRQCLVDEDFCLDEPVDKIYCMEVIEHVQRAQAVEMLNSFHRSLVPHGRVFITTPNYLSLWPFIEWGMDRLSVAPKLADVQHVSRFNKRSLTALCVEAGFAVDISTTCSFLAPWLAPLSWKFARTICSLEIRSPLPVGSILVFVLSKNQQS